MKTERDPIDVQFGAGLRARRNAMRISLEELGRRIGVTYQQIQKYETGANRVSVSTAFRIATALNCGIDDLTAAVASTEPAERVPAVSPADLRLALRIAQLPGDARRQSEGMVDIVADATAHALPLGPRADPHPLAH